MASFSPSLPPPPPPSSDEDFIRRFQIVEKIGEGSFGSVFATPIINQPNVAILGVGTVEKTPVVINDAIAIRSICYLALTFDHRLIDGALADMFTGRVKQLLENWTDSVL